jgi:hypothetical protein
MNGPIRYGLVSLLLAVLAFLAFLIADNTATEWLVVLFALGGIVLLIVGLIRGGGRTAVSRPHRD